MSFCPNHSELWPHLTDKEKDIYNTSLFSQIAYLYDIIILHVSHTQHPSRLLFCFPSSFIHSFNILICFQIFLVLSYTDALCVFPHSKGWITCITYTGEDLKFEHIQTTNTQPASLQFVSSALLPRWPCGSGVCLESGRPGSSHTSDLKIDTLVATLPGAWLYRVSAGAGWASVSLLGWVRSKV